MRTNSQVALTIAVLFGFMLALMACAPMSARPSADDTPRKASYAIPPDTASSLRSAFLPSIKKHKNKSGVKLLSYGEDALHLRLAMIAAAEHAIDLQYYIVENDDSDKLLIQSLFGAADRGVRIRLLMDSLNFHKDDPLWPLLNEHKNIEVRIFNPLVTRDTTWIGHVINPIVGLHHYSRRMHNKIVIADNQIAITGGRNLGDAYFDASQDFNFRDIDILAVGPLVPSLSKSFDKYWNDDESFPLVRVLPRDKDPKALEKLRADLKAHWEKDEANYKPVANKIFLKRLASDAAKLLWVDAQLAVDPPSKLDHPAEDAQSKPGNLLIATANRARQEFIIVSPYFVPRDEGVQWLKDLAGRGVKVRVLTNSLASTDAVIAHTGYSPYRQELARAGIELYEMKPIGERERSDRFGSNAPNSLHSKVYMLDRRYVLLGSFNFDPRSLELNTEQLIVIDSPELAKQVLAMFEKAISPKASFQVIEKNGSIEWKTTNNGVEKTYSGEPEAGFWRKTSAGFLSLLPAEDQL